MHKLIILNNGLKDHRGHYFETSIAIAEAARRAGLHPVLAAHKDCRAGLFREWLEVHAIFHTDHWMNEPLAQPPVLHRSSVAGADGKVHPFAGGLQQLCRNAAWASDRAAFYLCPPLIYDGGRRLSAAVAHQITPRIMRREYRLRFREFWRRVVGARHADELENSGAEECYPTISRAMLHGVDGPIVQDALQRLDAIDSLAELEYALIFKQDLERLLLKTGAGAGDHVLLGTAHAREILAVLLTARRLGPERTPAFHLEFRHPLVPCSPNFLLQRAFFALWERWGPASAIRCYTDTEELSRDYEILANAPVGVLPIPFRRELLSSRRRAPAEPLQIAYVGEARDEKGFHWLPGLIDYAISRRLTPGRVRFLVQANVSNPQHNPRCVAVLERLKRHSPAHVELRGLDNPLTPEEYYRLFSEADAVLLPYQQQRYRACSSGILAEALAGGRPAVAPEGTWMSAQLPPGAGKTFSDEASFFTAVEALIDSFDECRAHAEAHRQRWVQKHNPDRLVAAILESAAPHAASLQAAA